ncbi:MAG: hypothetical protein EBQ82_09505 [Betaproteobacteria bacterium]|nr:hypothetical protein [Betaproteobacteria bacterium]NBY05602.1 hypothetical protein [Betaproteobacteria bacterium]
MVMVMMLALMHVCTQGLRSLVHGLLTAASAMSVLDRLQAGCPSMQWPLQPAPIPTSSHNPPGG